MSRKYKKLGVLVAQASKDKNQILLVRKEEMDAL